MSITAQRGDYTITSQVLSRDISSNPRTHSVTFSPSSSYSRLGVVDSGIRYEVRLNRGRVEISMGAVWEVLDRGRSRETGERLPFGTSFQNSRAGEDLERVEFDMIVASRGRLLAKEAGTDQIFHLILDELFRTSDSSVRQNVPGILTRPARFSVLGDPPVPSSYLKLDPEFFTPDQGFTVPPAFDVNFAGHPASLRFKLFGKVTEAQASDMMCVMMTPLTWYLLDTRSPLKIFDIEDLNCIGDDELRAVATKQRLIPVIERFLTPIGDDLAVAAGETMDDFVDAAVAPIITTSDTINAARDQLRNAINTIDTLLRMLLNISGFGSTSASLLDQMVDPVRTAARAYDDLVEATNERITEAANEAANNMVGELAESLAPVFSDILATLISADIEAEGFAALFGPALLAAGMMGSQLKKEGVIKTSTSTEPSTSCSDRSEISVNLQRAFEFFKEHDNEALRQLIDRLILAGRRRRGLRIANAPPAGLPIYPHVVYEHVQGTAEIEPRPSINFDKVMDLGIGTSHWAEHWLSSFGGEIHSLLHRRPLFQQEQFSLAMYRFLNGPVIDGDSFVDGTTNFYMLVRLPVVLDSSEITGGIAPELSRRRFAILWCDEQTYFTQRWRLLHPTLDTAGDAVSLARQLRYNPEYFRFELSRFWDPFAHDCIHSQSRMAVTRQVIAVSGHDQVSVGPGRQLTPEIYTICFAFGMCDYTWRWRRFPLTTYGYLDEAVVGGNSRLQAPANEIVYPNTVGIREDATLHVRGFKRSIDGRSLIEGRWFQKYLPADCRHVPRRHELPNNQKPAVGFSHPWHFVSEDCYRNADRFYQFGVYQIQIDARSQYYEVELLPYENNVVPPVDPAVVWINRGVSAPDGKPLRIDTINFNWALPQDDDGYTRVSELEVDRSKEDLSLHEAKTRFRLLERGPRGVIAVFYDKRDDDLHAASHLPHFTLFEKENPVGPNDKLRVLVRGHRRVVQPPVVQKVQVRLNRSQGRTVSVTFSFWTSLSVDEAYESLWRFSLAALDNREAVPLFSAIVFGTFTRQAVPRAPLPLNFRTDEVLRPEFQYIYLWQGFDNTIAAALDRFCTPTGRMSSGTSAWFEDIVGHMATPDMIEFSVG